MNMAYIISSNTLYVNASNKIYDKLWISFASVHDVRASTRIMLIFQKRKKDKFICLKTYSIDNNTFIYYLTIRAILSAASSSFL